MILLYTLALVLFGLAAWLIARRAAALERKYTKVAVAVTQLVNDLSTKPGNAARDPAQHARRTYELGQLTAQRDQVETRYFKWRGLADKLRRWLTSLRTWKGKKLPYSLGALDVWVTLSLIDHLGFRDLISLKSILGWFGIN